MAFITKESLDSTIAKRYECSILINSPTSMFNGKTIVVKMAKDQVFPE